MRQIVVAFERQFRTEASSSARPTGAGSLNMPGAAHSSSLAWGLADTARQVLEKF